MRRDQEHVPLERNRSARYSPGRAADNGMLRFYLTPMRSGSARRGGGGLPSKAGPGRPLASQSFARSVLRMY
uniref:Uncharacterized protein n=1 Tax=Arundo donax TaxID=35708 RepID=A0A0A9HK51_ARUDO